MSKEVTKVEKPAETPRWNPWIAIFLAFITFFGSQFFASALLSLYPVIRGWNSTQANNWATNSTFVQFLFVLIIEATVVAVVYFFVKRYKDGFKNIGIRKPEWTDPLYGCVGIIIYFAIFLTAIYIAVHLFPSLNVNQKQQLGFNNVHGNGNLVLAFFSLVVFPPIAEEILFRGLIYSSLKKLITLWPAVIMTSFLFAIGHLGEGGSSGPLYIAAIDTFSLSLVLIFLREKTNGIWASITLHALKNAIAFISLFAIHFG